jgi:hypothetical protein
MKEAENAIKFKSHVTAKERVKLPARGYKYLFLTHFLSPSFL